MSSLRLSRVVRSSRQAAIVGMGGGAGTGSEVEVDVEGGGSDFFLLLLVLPDVVAASCFWKFRAR